MSMPLGVATLLLVAWCVLGVADARAGALWDHRKKTTTFGAESKPRSVKKILADRQKARRGDDEFDEDDDMVKPSKHGKVPLRRGARKDLDDIDGFDDDVDE